MGRHINPCFVLLALANFSLLNSLSQATDLTWLLFSCWTMEKGEWETGWVFCHWLRSNHHSGTQHGIWENQDNYSNRERKRGRQTRPWQGVEYLQEIFCWCNAVSGWALVCMYIAHNWCHKNITLILMQMKEMKACDAYILMTAHKYRQWKIPQYHLAKLYFNCQ